MRENFKILNKDESSNEMKRRDFGDFFSKTSRLVERALDAEFDVIGDFFVDDDENKVKNSKKDKIVQQF